MNYGKPRWIRIAVATLVSVVVALAFHHWSFVPIVLWLGGVLLRTVDIILRGGVRLNHRVIMSGGTWFFDFALRGYLESSAEEPVGF